MSNNDNQFPMYSRVSQWIKEYGVPGSDERRAAVGFLEIEAHETISSLRGELIALSNGRFEEATMDKIVGKARKLKYGSYEEWARSLLRWMVKS
jgi:hypothetical protein